MSAAGNAFDRWLVNRIVSLATDYEARITLLEQKLAAERAYGASTQTFDTIQCVQCGTHMHEHEHGTKFTCPDEDCYKQWCGNSWCLPNMITCEICSESTCPEHAIYCGACGITRCVWQQCETDHEQTCVQRAAKRIRTDN